MITLLRPSFLKLFACLVCLTIVISCNKDKFLADDTAPTSVDIDLVAAKAYYKELTLKKVSPAKIMGMQTMGAKAKPNKRYVLFSKAYQSKTDKYSFVEIPMLYNKRKSEVIGNKTTFNGIDAPLQQLNSSFDRLIIFKNKNTGKTDHRVVTYVPDVAYLKKHHNDASSNKINKLDKDFNGYIVYRNWDEKLLYIIKIKNGKGVRRIKPGQKQAITTNLASSQKTTASKKGKLSNVTTQALICEDIYEFHYEQTCYFTNPEQTEEVCSDWVLVGMTFLYQDCYEDGSPEYCDDPANFEECYGDPGDGGTTPPVRDIRNKTTDPCISKTVDAALKANKDVVGIMADIIKKFDATKTANINIYDGQIYYKDANGNSTGIPKPGETTNQSFIGNSFSANITLGIDYHDGTSKENLVTTLIHEIIHAYLGYTSNNFLKTETDHNVIADKYITPMAEYLHTSLNIPIKDAYALAWSGVSDSKVFNNTTPSDTEFTMSNNEKITVGDINTISGAYKLSTKDPSNNGYTKGVKICD